MQRNKPRLLLAGLLAVGLGACALEQSQADQGYADWTALVVAADDRADTGAYSAAFDNGRRDVAAALERLGFRPANIVQASADPTLFPDEELIPAEDASVVAALQEKTPEAPAGCFAYLTSHGNPDGIVFGREQWMSPAALDHLFDRLCPERPTVVVISACYSGVFAVPPVAQPDRIVMTAARPDRPSFGCGEDDIYTFFDGCVLQEIGQALSWRDLYGRVAACVEARETELELTPSGPQLFVGDAVRELADRPFAR